MIPGEAIIQMHGKKTSKTEKANWPEAGKGHTTERFAERRKCNRFKVRSGAFASIKSDCNLLAPMIDLSRGGLAFRYIGQGEHIRGPLEVDINYSGSGLGVQNLKSEIVSDFKIEKEAPGGSLAIRRCGIQFSELSNDQTSQLLKFIDKYAERRSGQDRRQFSDPGYRGAERRSGIDRRISPFLI